MPKILALVSEKIPIFKLLILLQPNLLKVVTETIDQNDYSGAYDCDAVCGGTAFVDGCGDCVGGDTGLEPCQNDCNGDLGGDVWNADDDCACDDVDQCPDFYDCLDTDGDTTPDCLDTCPLDAENDIDGDGLCCNNIFQDDFL